MGVAVEVEDLVVEDVAKNSNMFKRAIFFLKILVGVVVEVVGVVVVDVAIKSII